MIRDEENENQKHEFGGECSYFQKASMTRDGRTFIDRFIDKYWLVNITRIEERKDRKFTIS